MSTVPLSSFDTLRYVQRLRAADVPESQAEAQAEALREALADQSAAQAGQVATKADIAEVRSATKAEFADVRNAITEVRGDVKLLKWMLGSPPLRRLSCARILAAERASMRCCKRRWRRGGCRGAAPPPGV